MAQIGAEPVKVAAVILYREGAVLLQHRDDRPDIVWPGAWAIFGGHVEPGEAPEAAAIREIQEELGLRLEPPLRLLCRHEAQDRERFIFAAPLPVPPEGLVLMEGQGMALIPRHELDRYPIVPLHRQFLERFFEEQY